MQTKREATFAGKWGLPITLGVLAAVVAAVSPRSLVFRPRQSPLLPSGTVRGDTVWMMSRILIAHPHPSSSPSSLSPTPPPSHALLPCAAQYLMGSGGPANFHRVSLKNEAQLKSVFFSGHPWAVFCSQSPADDPELVAPQQLINAAAITDGLGGAVKLALIDCRGRMPSGRSVLSRFSLEGLRTDIKAGAGLYTARLSPPSALPSGLLEKALVDAEPLLSFLRRETKPGYYPIQSQADLEAHCLGRKACVMVMTRTSDFAGLPQTALGLAARAFRAVSFVHVDTSRFRVDFRSPGFALPATSPQDQQDRWPKVIAMRAVKDNLPPGLANPSSRRLPVRLTPMEGSLTTWAGLEPFLDSVFGPAEEGLMGEKAAAERRAASPAAIARASAVGAVSASEGLQLTDRQAAAKAAAADRAARTARNNKLKAERREQAKRDAAGQERLAAQSNADPLVMPVDGGAAAAGSGAGSDAGAGAADWAVAGDSGAAAGSSGKGPEEEEESVDLD